MRFLSTILLLALLCTACRKHYQEAAPVSQLPPKDKFELFLLVGQSNMAGRGEVSEQDRVVHPRVLSLSKDGEWIPAMDPIHFDKPFAGVGLGRTFGITLADKEPDVTIGLIPAAVGGSAIASWKPGGFHEQTQVYPYDDAIKRARRAMQDGTLKAILWHQGESDAEEGRAAIYKEELEAVIARFRKDLNAPDVPFIIGQLGEFEGRPWNDWDKMVDEAQKQVAAEVPNTAFVSSEGLTSNPDNVHFNAESQHEFGKRFAEKYLELTTKKKTETPD